MIKDGKLFGKINLFDVGILVLLVVLVGAGLSKFRTFGKAIDVSTLGRITYTMEIYDVRDYTANGFISGDNVYDSGTNVNIGVIKNIETRPAQSIRTLADGSVKILENDFKKDVILTIETVGTVTDLGYFANKSIELKVGSEKTIETRYIVASGRITSINYTEGE